MSAISHLTMTKNLFESYLTTTKLDLKFLQKSFVPHRITYIYFVKHYKLPCQSCRNIELNFTFRKNSESVVMGTRKLISLIKIRAKNLFDKLNRTKSFTNATTPLRRCLTMFDIVFLGIGHMVGGGLYKSTGQVIKETTGPAIFLSYILAGLAAFLAALCYAEMEGRIPTAGSAYSFTYVTIGELWAFLVGWSMLLENMVGAAALGTAWSSTFDYLIDKKISTMTLQRIGPIPNLYGVFGSDTGPDFLAAALVIIVSLMICLGSRRSANFNTAFAILNLLVMAFVVTYGMSTKRDYTLWTDADKCPRSCSNLTMANHTCNVTSAFLPYGPTSIVKGASQVFFAYIGFNCIASAGEETKLPHRSLPLGTMISLGIVTVAYVTMSATLTLLVPYCNISVHAPFPTAFLTSSDNSKYIYYFISIGSLSAMTTVLFGNLFVIPRTVYSMASDGVLFKIFKKIYSKTQVPIAGVLLFGALAAVLASCFKLEALTEMTSLGTLLSYSIVACCVILLRYKEDSAKYGGKRPTGYGETGNAHNDAGTLKKQYSFLANILNKIFPLKPTPMFILLMIPFLIGVSILVVRGGHERWSMLPWWCILIASLLGVCSLILVFLIFAHRASDAKLHFKVKMTKCSLHCD